MFKTKSYHFFQFLNGQEHFISNYTATIRNLTFKKSGFQKFLDIERLDFRSPLYSGPVLQPFELWTTKHSLIRLVCPITRLVSNILPINL